ncbi:MAG: hypothetical protein ACE5JS_02750 [Nitrospinota bacterium]
MRRCSLKAIWTILLIGAFVGASVLGMAQTAQATYHAANPCNPCAAKKAANPCNPCAAKKAANPCNPCAAKKAANPCNPCAAKKAANPCNPCAAKANPCNPCAAGAAKGPSAKARMIIGKVIYASADHLSVQWNGKKLRVGVHNKTRFTRGREKSSAKTIKAGERIIVSMLDRGGRLSANYVYLAKAGMAGNPCNPCAAKANPCNPCAAKANPCNPCAAKANPCNPCAAKANPCNPCAAK